MSVSGATFLTHAVLASRGVPHGFGLRSSPEPEGLLRVRQVHGPAVVLVREPLPGDLGEADAVVSAVPGRRPAVATADCVPVLAAAAGGRVVAAIHAGWRGLAAGVVAEAMAALRREAGSLGAGSAEVVAAVGPCIGGCCYEVDEPVLAPLARRFGAELDRVLGPGRPGHALLDLGALVRVELLREGLDPAGIGVLERACTHCDAGRFHSFRRDGAAAGRLLHWVAPRPASPDEG
jgi:hypothetical protein